MGIVFLILALGCFLYFGFLWTTASYLSFLWIWLLLGAIHLLMAFVYKAPERLRKNFWLKQLLHFFPAFQLSYRLFKPISLWAVEGSPFLYFGGGFRIGKQ